MATARILPCGRRAMWMTMISPVLSQGSRLGTERSSLPGAYSATTSMTAGRTGRCVHSATGPSRMRRARSTTLRVALGAAAAACSVIAGSSSRSSPAARQ